MPTRLLVEIERQLLCEKVPSSFSILSLGEDHDKLSGYIPLIHSYHYTSSAASGGQSLTCENGAVWPLEDVSAEMKHFFNACELLLHEMFPQDFSDKECKLIEHYSLELYVRYGSRRN